VRAALDDRAVFEHDDPSAKIKVETRCAPTIVNFG